VQAPEWALMDDAHRIERTFRFRDFHEALQLGSRPIFMTIRRASSLASIFACRASVGLSREYR
jgi:hypothetical protein